MQVYNDELYHFGKLGMKWGHHKLKIGINDSGNISIVKKTNKKGVKKFLVKAFISTSGIALSVYVSKHPNVIIKGSNIVSNILKKDTVSTVTKDSYIFSKKLGRLLKRL